MGIEAAAAEPLVEAAAGEVIGGGFFPFFEEAAANALVSPATYAAVAGAAGTAIAAAPAVSAAASFAALGAARRGLPTAAAPVRAPVARMPVHEDTAAARRLSIAEQKRRMGRASTILTSPEGADTLG